MTVYLFMLTLLITDGFYNYSAILMVLLSLYYSLFYSKNNLSSLEKFFLLSYLAMFLVPFWSSMMHKTSFSEIKKSIIYGNVMGSFAVEKYGLAGLTSLKKSDIAKRVKQYEKMVSF